MRWILRCMVVCCLALTPARAQERAQEVAGQIIYEAWYESKTDQGKLGHLHLVARAVEREGQKLIRTTLRDETIYIRSGDPYEDAQEQETLETSTGEVREVSYGISLSKSQKLKLVGTPEGDKMTLRIADSVLPYVQVIPWDPRAKGLYAMEVHFHGKKLNPGDTVTMLAFNPVANRVVPTTLTVVGKEVVKLNGQERQLTRVEQTFPSKAYLSNGTLWLDEGGRVVRMQDEDTSLFGTLVREVSTKESATAPFKPNVTDKEAPILVDKRIRVGANRPKELRLRVQLDRDNEPGTIFPEDTRQVLVRADEKAAEWRLLARPLATYGPPPEPEPEYLESNFFIRSDDALVKKHAQAAVENRSTPRAQLQGIRKWVSANVRGCYEVAFATADEVARTLEGDCSEIGVLTAAMCRAVGIPSRVAFGLVYDPEHQGFGGHLWCEVYVDGAWEPFDVTGVVHALNAAYLRVGSFSMKNVLNPDEMVEVRRAFAGQMRVELLEQK